MLSGYTSYALFSDTIISNNVINLKVGKIKRNTYSVIKSQFKTNGVSLYDGTDDNAGEYSIYYYRGNVTNNNVLFANMCWKIVRTTSTGGTKLIYNGVPSDDGKCNNTGTASQIGKSAFNTNYSSPADVGYMYGTRYTSSSEYMDWYRLVDKRSYDVTFLSSGSVSSNDYYYGDSVTYSDGVYTLNNAEQHTWSSDYSNLKGYYTFFNSSTSSTAKPSYIAGSTSSRAYYTTYGDEKMGMGKNVTYGNGRYTITDYTLIDKKDFYNNTLTSRSYYLDYYVCSNNSNSCSEIRHLVYAGKGDSAMYSYVDMSGGETYASIVEDFENNPWVYGNDVTYSNGVYTLVKTKTSNPTKWSTDKEILADGYHYTCLNSTGTCTSVYYITYFASSTMYYLTFTGGDTLESAKTKMFTNTTDSTIKTYIDEWYEDNLIDYTGYLEDTIFCNDRSFASDEIYTVTRSTGTDTENGGALSSKDTNPVNYSYFKSYENTGKGTPSLICSNINDRFSLKVDSGGTNGYGNNTLTYPVGLLTLDEAKLAGGLYKYFCNNYLEGSTHWLMSPAYWEGYGYSSAYGGVVNMDGRLNKNGLSSSLAVRPAISLTFETQIIQGTGTTSDPYVITE